MQKPRQDIRPNTAEYETLPLVKPTGFREYDARWILEKEINLLGIQALGLGLATYVHEIGQTPKIAVGHDFRGYSLSVKQALILGLLEGGMEVLDIGLALSPMAYYAQFALDCPCVAMVTASHNENGWTGVKMGAQAPLTFGPDEMGRLKEIVLNGQGVASPGGRLERIEGFRETYIKDVASKVKLSRPLKVVAACGNGTAGAFAPEVLRLMGAEVIEMDTDLDYTFPKYNPNPEDHAMLVQMAAKVKETGADLALGFDGDGDRCGVVDDTGEEIFADKIGLMLARDLSALHTNATFVVDVKSTGLYKTDEVLKANGATTVYWKTGHSYIKRKTAELGAAGGWMRNYSAMPATILAPLLGLAGLLASAVLLRARRGGLAFIASGAAIAGIILTVGFAIFPFLLPSSTMPGAGLTLWDASSSRLTLWIMLLATVVFLPLILLYTAWVYRVLRGPVTDASVADTPNAY